MKTTPLILWHNVPRRKEQTNSVHRQNYGRPDVPLRQPGENVDGGRQVLRRPLRRHRHGIQTLRRDSEKYLTKLCFNFVPNLLVAAHMSTRTKILGRYVNFFRSLLMSECVEVALVANTAGRQVLDHGHQPDPPSRRDRTQSLLHQQVLWDREDPVPPREMWKNPLLQNLLSHRNVLDVNCEETRKIYNLIDSLCMS